MRPASGVIAERWPSRVWLRQAAYNGGVRRGYAVMLLAIVLGLSGCGRSGRAAGGVPPQVVSAIKTRFPGMAYLPTRVPTGQTFLNWVHGSTGYDIHFHGKQTDVTFSVVLVACSAEGSPMHNFRVNGDTVEWSTTQTDQQTWLCMNNDGKSFVIQGSGTGYGDDYLRTARGMASAQALANLVGYARVKFPRFGGQVRGW
jgi:hypothetical protein